MKLKLLLPAITAVPLPMIFFKSENPENASENKFQNVKKIDYSSNSPAKGLQDGEGFLSFLATSSHISKNTESSIVSTTSALTSFAATTFDDSTLREFLKSHE